MKFLSIFVLFIALVGCDTTPVSEPTIDLTAAPTDEAAESTEATSTIPEDWQTYTDDIVGFTFRYPPNWVIQGGGSEESVIYAITLQDAPFAEEGAGGLPADITKIDVVVDNSTTYEGLEEARDAWFDLQGDGQGQGTSEIASETRQTLADGREVIVVTTTGTPVGETYTAIMLVNQHLVSGNILHGDIETLVEIMSTIQPA